MKRLFTLVLISAPALLVAQAKVVNQAIITTTTMIVAPDDDENAPQQMTSNDGGEVRVMRFGGDGETKTTTWLKNDLVKTFSESDMGRTTLVRDNSKKITTTIMEMMGRKTGFYASDDDQEMIRKRMDSMMRANPNAPVMPNNAGNAVKSTELVLVDEQKKIAGYDTKKALLVSLRSSGKYDTTIVWYSTGYKLQGLNNTGGALGGFGGFSAQAAPGMELLPGFPMQYERTMNRGRKMTVKVTKLVIDKEVADKEFEMPKDIEIKAMKDMQNGMGGPQIQFRMGGN